MVNKQSIAFESPNANQRELFLILFCPKCNTYKPFKITEALKNLLRRESREIRYESECMVCGNKVGAAIEWA